MLQFHLFIIGKAMVFNGHFLGFRGGAGQQAQRGKRQQKFHPTNVGKDWGNKKCWGFGFIGYFCTILCYFCQSKNSNKQNK